MSERHSIERVRHALRYRRVTVVRTEVLTPRMRRIVVGGESLEGFTSPGFDDHVKLFFPDATGRLPEPVVGDTALAFPEAEPRPPGRDFTPRRFDAARRELTIDFGLHARGPATAWASRAAPGSPLAVAGPRGSARISDTFAWHLLIGDDTALPAIARRLEELPAGRLAIVVVEVDDRLEQVPLESAATVQLRWVHRRGAGEDTIENAVSGLTLPPGDGFAWVAGEAAMARRVRRHVIEDRHLDPAWVKAAAYWKIGTAGRHEVIAG